MKAVASSAPPRYERTPTATLFTPFEERVRTLLSEHPEMPATVIAERVGWTGSITWFRDNVRRMRPEHRRPDPADRLAWAAGDAAQCDLWFPPRQIPLEDGTNALLPVLVIVAAHSRLMTGRMLPSRQTADLLLGMWSLIEQLGQVPRRLIWDNEAGIGRRGRLAAGVAEFCGTLATRLHQLKPHDPESKGIVERRNGFFETSFMPGRDFASPGDFNAQFTGWIEQANRRMVRTLKGRPIDLVDIDRALLRTLVARPKFRFPDLLDQGSEAGLIAPSELEPLRAMNKLRVAAKHHGSRVTIEDVFHHYLVTFPSVVALSTKARKSAKKDYEADEPEPPPGRGRPEAEHRRRPSP
ncbi:MAG: transposase [Ilumatobacteraceae bacterium]|nr:transposase [Ilumatobacteraceae bacterium]